MNIKKLGLAPLLLASSIFSLSGCQSNNTLLILNWGEYINQDLVDAFEKEYNCNVIISLADSNELFYSKVKSGTTVYDLVVPSDYMVEKMTDKNLLQKIDFNRLENYKRETFMPGVNGILDEMDKVKEGIRYSDYCIPYFWGTFGLMYNNRNQEVADKISTYGWDAYFKPEILSDKYSFGMYNVPRDVYAATMFYNHLSPNELDDDLLKLSSDTLMQRHFDAWGTDTLKKSVEAENLDVAFMYTGDYLDMAYQVCDSMDKLENLNIDIYIPDETIAFLDTLVMTKNARHVDLAYQFINYMMEPDNYYENASVVGYCTPSRIAYDKIIDGKNTDDPWLQVWSYFNNKCYPLPKETDEKQFSGTPLTYFSQEDLARLTNIVNKAKIS